MTKDDFNKLTDSVILRTINKLSSINDNSRYYILAYTISCFAQIWGMTEDDTFKRHDFMSFKTDLLNTENIEHICATYYFGFHAYISSEYAAESYEALLYLGQVAWSQPTSYAIRWKDLSCVEYANGTERFNRIIQFMSEEINPIMGVSVQNPSASVFHHIASRDCGKAATEMAKTPSFIQKANEYFNRARSGQNPKTTGCLLALTSLGVCYALIYFVFVYAIFI